MICRLSSLCRRVWGIVLLILACQTYAADWYWRPLSGGPYGNSDGSSYDDAWNDVRSIQWNKFSPGDVLHVCGRHDTGYADNVLRVRASGAADAPLRITGACPGDPGSILSAGARWVDGWVGPDEHGIYYRQYAGTATQAMDDQGPLVSVDSGPGPEWPCRAFAQRGRRFSYKPCGSVRVVYPAGPSPVIEINGQDFVHIDNLVLENANKLIVVVNATGFSLTDSLLRYGRHSAILVRGRTKDGVIGRNEIHDSGYGIYFVTRSTDKTESHDRWVVENNHIHDIFGTRDAHCIGWQTGKNNLVRGNRLHDCEGSGITFYDWGGGAKVAFNVIEDNDIYDIRDAGYGGKNQRGIEVNGNNCPRHPDDSVGNVVRNNRIRNVDHDAMYIKAARPTTPGVFSWAFIGNVVEGAENGVVWKNAHPYGEVREESVSQDPCAAENLIEELSRPGFLLENNTFRHVKDSFIRPKRINPRHRARNQDGIISRHNTYVGRGRFVWQTTRTGCRGGVWQASDLSCVFTGLARYQEVSGTDQGSTHISGVGD